MSRGFFCVRGVAGKSDPDIAQGLNDIAQGAGQGRVFDLEALYRQINVVDKAGVLGCRFYFDLGINLFGEFVEVGSIIK